MSNLIVIPARFGSQRLPGKPLIRIAGRTLLERVVNLARHAASGIDDTDIVVATDHEAIAAHAAELGCRNVMTDAGITSGTGRALAAARMEEAVPQIVVNLQGDAPFMPASAIAALITELRRTGAGAATPVLTLSWEQLDALREHKLSSPHSGTTCIRAPDGRALWFSKTIIPSIRNEARLRTDHAASPVLRHIGLYAYTMETLDRFEAAPPSFYEQLEGLEQLRLLELGIEIRAVEVGHPPISISGIDTADDVHLAEAMIARFGDPYRAL
ncbi:MAG: 3-deoxy-manno-octulosonate cytidylyltransferase [Alphaproteobacteria bacterium]|nr:3-deoxy-manno-octulosonate cytidylyltransferase [Alphaproteobacteria bacterium]